MSQSVSAPATLHKLFDSNVGRHVLVTDHSGIYDVPAGLPEDSAAFAEFLTAANAAGWRADLSEIAEPEPQSLSLNVSATCNLACGYCYAGQGGFGGSQPKGMESDVARAAVDALFARADPSRPVTIGFLGGEPFMNRPLIHEIVAYASTAGRQRALDVRFAVTTNATLLRDEDIRLVREHQFSVTVSLDGDEVTHDQNRPAQGGRGSWRRAVDRCLPLLREPHTRVAARATVTATGLDLERGFSALTEAGFQEVGFSPLRSGPRAISGDLWIEYASGLKGIAAAEIARLKTGLPLRLSNLAIALKELHRGAASPYPCGAGGGYFSVAANGDWYACHRVIGRPEFKLGDNSGLDPARRRSFLRDRHVDAQTDCTRCWARYLCSGGCHQEADARSPESCDFVRDWLTFCLTNYCELQEGMRA